MTQSSSLTKVSTLIAKVNQEQENTVRVTEISRKSNRDRAI
ncbi:MAG: hypothetical protein AB4368_31075 [Xenococcaceae cyanobacterium]